MAPRAPAAAVDELDVELDDKLDAKVDEEALASGLDTAERRARGAWFTPAPLVELVLSQVAALVPAGRPLAIIDPACGAGAFLSAARARFPTAALLGLELTEDFAAQCARRVPDAFIARGDALRGGLAPLLARVPAGAFELWIGNPPYNGTSAVLKDAAAYASLRGLLPERFELPKGTSLRDDYAFFLLLAARRLEQRDGALAFITSATLLDAFLYAPVRHALLESLALREVVELGGDAFSGTRVRTCVTVWTSRRGAAGPPRYRARRPEPDDPWALTPAVPLTPSGPEWLLRPADEAQALDQTWRAEGEPLTQLVPVSFPGLKTRFDELLVDDDPERLLARVAAFLATPAAGLEAFARAHALPERTWPKLSALKEATAPLGLTADPSRVRPFFRFAGARHRGRVPPEARAYCYLERHLIPRGDHRLRGRYDPHAGHAKLLFNVRELPLFAAVLEEEGCVHDHRHTRFAPLHVPRRVLEEGPEVTRAGGDLGPPVPNLSARGLALAGRLGGPLAVFQALSDFINSAPVQEVWAPALGAARELPVPVERLVPEGRWPT